MDKNMIQRAKELAAKAINDNVGKPKIVSDIIEELGINLNHKEEKR